MVKTAYFRFFLSLILTIIVGNSQAQITVLNASFEDEPSDATTPQGWMPCDDMTTPDILPGFWGVYNEPSHGETYVGIITRENGTFESFGQRLNATIRPNSCYQTEIDLAHSIIYSGYNKPVKLRVYLGSSICSRDQLIYESPFIEHMNWKTYKIKFQADALYDYIILEAYYKDAPFSHKGNILMDNLKPFTRCGNA